MNHHINKNNSNNITIIMIIKTSGAWLLQEYHCSVSRVAEAFPLICDQELQVMRHTFPDCTVERVHWKLDGDHSCGFRLEPRG